MTYLLNKILKIMWAILISVKGKPFRIIKRPRIVGREFIKIQP